MANYTGALLLGDPWGHSVLLVGCCGGGVVWCGVVWWCGFRLTVD